MAPPPTLRSMDRFGASTSSSDTPTPPWHLRGRKPPLLPTPQDNDPRSKGEPSDPWGRVDPQDPWGKIDPSPSRAVMMPPTSSYTAHQQEPMIRIPPYGSGVDQYGRPLPAASVMAPSTQTRADTSSMMTSDALLLGAQLDTVNTLYSNTTPLDPTR